MPWQAHLHAKPPGATGNRLRPYGLREWPAGGQRGTAAALGIAQGEQRAGFVQGLATRRLRPAGHQGLPGRSTGHQPAPQQPQAYQQATALDGTPRKLRARCMPGARAVGTAKALVWGNIALVDTNGRHCGQCRRRWAAEHQGAAHEGEHAAHGNASARPTQRPYQRIPFDSPVRRCHWRMHR